MSTVSHGEIASNTSTSDDSFVAPGADQKPPSHLIGAQFNRLKTFLQENFPEELDRSNVQHKEAVCDVAIRLLKGLHSQVPPSQIRRCPEQYCNQPERHEGSHGWVNYG